MITKEELEQLYLEEGLTETQIADKLGTYQVKISRLRRKYEIPTITKSERLNLPPLSKTQRELVIGSLLGDGWCSKVSGSTARFHINHGEKQKDYLIWKKSFLENYVSGDIRENTKREKGKIYKSFSFTTKTSDLFWEFYDLFYNTGKRVFPETLPDLITPLALAVWYMDDGNCQHFSPRISFGLCEKSLVNATKALLSLGLQPSFHEDKRTKNKSNIGGVFRFPGQSEKFFNLISEYVPDCMKYKIPELSDRKKKDLKARKLTHLEALRLKKEGFTISQIAKKFGTSNGTVRRRLKSDLKKINYKKHYSAEEAHVKLLGYDPKIYANLPEDEKKEWVETICDILMKTEFPYPKLPEKTQEEMENFSSLECFLDEEKSIRPKSNKGLPLCYPFFPNRYEAVSSSTNKKAYEMWFLKKELKRAIQLQLKYGDPVVPHRVLRAITMNARTPTIFRPGVAKYLYETYVEKGSWVYDPCAGYGGRLLGAMAAGVRYMATDVEKRTIEGNQELAKFLGYEDRVDLHLCPAESFEIPKEVSFIFTSPPYFEAEKYSKGEDQSYVKHGDSLESWVEGFLRPVFEKSFKALKEGGYLGINIADVKRNKKVYKLEGKVLEVAGECGFKLEETLKMPLSNLNRVRNFEPIFIWGVKK